MRASLLPCARRHFSGPAGSVLVLLCATILPTAAAAQTSSAWSIQGSALGNTLFGDQLEAVKTGIGFEGQLRYTPGLTSWGFGGQYTVHGVEGDDDESVSLAGAFVEPRRVVLIGSESVAPYLSGRLSISTINSTEATGRGVGFTVNGGGGFLISLGGSANLDLGATFGFKKLGEVEVPSGTLDLGQGTNLIVRAGLAVGLGGD